MVGSRLVKEVLADWESIINEVAKAVVGEKIIVCGRAERWWGYGNSNVERLRIIVIEKRLNI